LTIWGKLNSKKVKENTNIRPLFWPTNINKLKFQFKIWTFYGHTHYQGIKTIMCVTTKAKKAEKHCVEKVKSGHFHSLF